MKEDRVGRFCDQCSKTVIDFTTWTDAELYNYFYRRDEHVCGRFLNTQLGRKIRIPYQPHSKLYRIAVALGAALIFIHTSEAHAQWHPPMAWSPASGNNTDTIAANNIAPGILTGHLVDDKKEPIVNAMVVIKVNGIQKAITVTDYDGNYEIKGLEPGIYDVTFSYIATEAKTFTGVPVTTDKTRLDATLVFDPKKVITVGTLVGRPPLINLYEPKTIFRANDIKHKPGW